MTLTKNTRLLFLGDSITDCGRREDSPDHLGAGHVRILRDWLLARDPADCPTVLNRGVGGNTVLDLADRWDRDVLDERPDVLSVKIGINDVWRQLDGKAPGVMIGPFTDTYRNLLRRTRDALPDCRLVLCEPSIIGPSVPGNGNELLKPYVAAVGSLAREFDATLVPLHAAFLQTQAARPDIDWATDGVHPTGVGHALIARTWLAATGLL